MFCFSLTQISPKTISKWNFLNPLFNEFLSNLSSQAQILHIKYPWLHVYAL